MIVFLTLLYVGLLALLVKIRLIKLNLFWKLSPLLWMVLLFVALFIPMQWGAPGGTVNVYQYVVEITPNVSGEVTEVSVQPLQPVKKGDLLFKIDPTPFQATVNDLEAGLKLAEINLKRAQKLYAKKAGPKIDVDRLQAEADQYQAKLEKARYDLRETRVRAPGNGYATGVTLRPGQRVTNLPLQGWLSFVNDDSSRVVIGIDQIYARHVQMGQKAEVTFKILPGKVIPAKVIAASPITPQAQLGPSGAVPSAPTPGMLPQPYGVVLKLEKDAFVESGLAPLDISRIPGGAIGSGAVYTDSVGFTHVIRKIMLRMQSWLNYILPY